MPSKLRQLNLSPDEETFLRQWMRDEANYLAGQGVAKRLQLAHRVPPADLAMLVAAAFPELQEQAAVVMDQPHAGEVSWPWTEATLRSRLQEAREYLGLPLLPSPNAARQSAPGAG